MTKKTTKKSKKTGQRLDRGESLYTPELAERAKQIIIDAQLVKSDGTIYYAKLAKLLDIPSRTFSAWRNAGSKYYKPDFVKALAAAHDELMENIDLRKIHANVILRAQGRTREITVTKEPVVEGPVLPAFSRFTKADLVEYAKNVLKLKLKPKLSKGSMEMAIRKRVDELTVEKMKVVREVKKTVPGDNLAAKYADQNIGPKDERWTDKQVVDIEGKSLADIAAIMMGKKVG